MYGLEPPGWLFKDLWLGTGPLVLAFGQVEGMEGRSSGWRMEDP